VGSRILSSRNSYNSKFSKYSKQSKISAKIKPKIKQVIANGDYGDEDIVSLLFPKSKLDYIFKGKTEWVQRVKTKLVKWTKIIYTVMNNKKFLHIRKITSRMSSRQSNEK